MSSFQRVLVDMDGFDISHSRPVGVSNMMQIFCTNLRHQRDTALVYWILPGTGLCGRIEISPVPRGNEFLKAF